jgi:hypothetical protein
MNLSKTTLLATAGSSALILAANAALINTPKTTTTQNASGVINNTQAQHVKFFCAPPKRLSSDYKECLPPFKYNNADKIGAIVGGSICGALIIGISAIVLYKKYCAGGA